MDASVIVCTYNRCESLADTLAAIANLRVPDGFQWELIVVDNNSRDATKSTVEHLRLSLPGLRMRYMFQQQQGLSHARNLGLSAASGEFVVFTDDDVIPDPEWLEQLVNGMRQYRCAAAGGFIEPLWQGKPPAWLTERFYGFLALRTDHEGPKEVCVEHEMPFGANLAFERRMFETIGVFNPDLGRKGNTLAGGEEIDVLMRVVRHGGRVMYFPHARVRHKVEAFRLKKGYFRRWRYQGSLNQASTWPQPGGRQIAGVPLYLWRQLAQTVWKTLLMYLTRPADEAFRQEMVIWHLLGLIRGLVSRTVRT